MSSWSWVFFCFFFNWHVIRLSCLQQEQKRLGHLLVAMSLWAQKVASYLLDGVLWPVIAEPEYHNLLFHSPDIFWKNFWYALQWVNQLWCMSLFAIPRTSLHYTSLNYLFIHRQITKGFKLMLTSRIQLSFNNCLCHLVHIHTQHLGPCNQINPLVSFYRERQKDISTSNDCLWVTADAKSRFETWKKTWSKSWFYWTTSLHYKIRPNKVFFSSFFFL